MMKRFFAFIALVMLCSTLCAQQVFTVVYATSDDGFLNVRTQPSMKGKVIEKLWAFSHGLGTGIYRGEQGNWTRVSVGDVAGWVYTKYVGKQTWYKGNGKPRLVAKADFTTIYRESMADDVEHYFFGKVPRGTILADDFDQDETYYILKTVHDFLFIRKQDAEVVR